MPRPYIPPELREDIFGPNWRELQAMNNRQRNLFKQLLLKKSKPLKAIMELMAKMDKSRLAGVPRVALANRRRVDLKYLSREDEEEVKGKHLMAIEWMYKMVKQGNPATPVTATNNDERESFKIKYQSHLLKIWFDKKRMPLSDFNVFCEYIRVHALGMKLYRDLVARCTAIIKQFTEDEANEDLRNMAKRVKKLKQSLEELKNRSENLKWDKNTLAPLVNKTISEQEHIGIAENEIKCSSEMIKAAENEIEIDLGD